jgi:hypothetical protein
MKYFKLTLSTSNFIQLMQMPITTPINSDDLNVTVSIPQQILEAAGVIKQTAESPRAPLIGSSPAHRPLLRWLDEFVEGSSQQNRDPDIIDLTDSGPEASGGNAAENLKKQLYIEISDDDNDEPPKGDSRTTSKKKTAYSISDSEIIDLT